MTTTTNQHGEKETVIGTRADGRGGRVEIVVVEYMSSGRKVFAMRGCHGGDAGRFSTQVRRAKTYLAHPSNQAEWAV